MTFIPLNFSCLTCGTLDYLKEGVVGENVSKDALARIGIPLDEGDKVLICQECFYEVSM